MIQLIGPYPPSRAEVAKRGTLSDPDLLLEIATRTRAGSGPGLPVDDAFSLILHDLRMGGTWKRTNRGRLPITERILCEHLHQRSSGDIAVLDLGGSDGITTLELASALRMALGDRVRLYMTDLSIWLLRYRKGPLVEYRAPDGVPVMVRIGPFGLRLSDERRTEDQSKDPLAKLYLKLSALRKSMWFDLKISLVHPLVSQEPDITVMQLNCLEKNSALCDRFEAVRASNVLNLGYFTVPQLRQAVLNIHHYLRDDGYLLISRNHDVEGGETENGSVWRKSGSRFLHLTDFGTGSEVKSIVNDWGTLTR